MPNLIPLLSKNKKAIFGVLFIEMLILFQGIYCYYAISTSKSILVFTAAVMIIVAIIAAVLFLRRSEQNSKKISRRIFLAVLIVLGSFYLFEITPNSVPDEIYHFQSSYKYSDYLLGEETSSTAISIRAEDETLFNDYRVKVSLTHYNDVSSNFELFASTGGTSQIATLSSFDVTGEPPQLKIASALGITVGRVLNLGAYPVYYLGRLFNLISFILLVYFAVRITPVGKNIFMAVALLPMTLHLAASYSYDVALVGMTFLMSALCLKAIYGDGLISKKLLAGIGVLVFLIAPCKIVYASAALLIFLIPKERFSSRKVSFAIKGGLLLLALVSIVVIRLSSLLAIATAGSATVVSGSNVATQSLDVRGDESGTFYSIPYVLSHPFDTFLMYLSAFGSAGTWYVETAIGSSLGWFQEEIVANDLVVFSFIIILLVASLKSTENSREIKTSLRVVSIVVVITVCLLIGASMLLGHTFIGEEYIKGIQGRYILPVAPLLLLALQNNKIVYNGNQAPVILICSLSLNLLYLNYIYAVALTL